MLRADLIIDDDIAKTFFADTDDKGFYSFEDFDPGRYKVDLHPPSPFPSALGQLNFIVVCSDILLTYLPIMNR